MEQKPSRSMVCANDVAALLRARTPLIWVVTREEARVETHLMEAAIAAKYVPRTWDNGQGVADMKGTVDPNPELADPGETLNLIAQRARSGNGVPGVWIMRDLPPWLNGAIGLKTSRQLRNLARSLPSFPRDKAQAIIVLTTSAEVPAELADHATIIEWPLPDRTEIGDLLDEAIDALPDDAKAKALQNNSRETVIEASVGLSGEEASSSYAVSLVRTGYIDPAVIATEKKRIIARERLLEWFDPLPGGLDAVGGLDVLKSWLVSRKSAFSPAARAYGLPAPRGAFLAGISGCGKSLTAKAVATAWGVPLLRFDLNALKSKYVGESEGNLRRALKVIEAIGRCVVWVDEVEKSLAGATQGAADGGVSADALGYILSWMQERAGEAFVVATANDISSLPPEMLRKGRFDEIWWIDLPTYTERSEIIAAALRAHGRGKAKIDCAAVADACEGFTGAEIAELVPTALYAAFAEKAREITTKDLLNAAEMAKEALLSKTAKEKIESMRSWAQGRARPATTPETAIRRETKRGRAIDMGAVT